jgi:hypothetical protein
MDEYFDGEPEGSALQPPAKEVSFDPKDEPGEEEEELPQIPELASLEDVYDDSGMATLAAAQPLQQEGLVKFGGVGFDDDDRDGFSSSSDDADFSSM